MQACLNGARRPGAHPALPVTPDAIARDTSRARAAGADSVHVHVKDGTGADTLAAEPLAAVLAAVRREAPGTPVGVTTGAWAVPDAARRVRAVREWTVLPDFASVNWHEEGADEVAAALLERGVGVEAGVWHDDGAERFAVSPLRERCRRVLVELPDGLDGAATHGTADRLLARVGSAAPGVPVLLHGEGSSAWTTLRYAARLGLDTRVGLEDVLVLPDGRRAPDNAALVRTGRLLQSMRGSTIR